MSVLFFGLFSGLTVCDVRLWDEFKGLLWMRPTAVKLTFLRSRCFKGWPAALKFGANWSSRAAETRYISAGSSQILLIRTHSSDLPEITLPYCLRISPSFSEIFNRRRISWRNFCSDKFLGRLGKIEGFFISNPWKGTAYILSSLGFFCLFFYWNTAYNIDEVYSPNFRCAGWVRFGFVDI